MVLNLLNFYNFLSLISHRLAYGTNDVNMHLLIIYEFMVVLFLIKISLTFTFILIVRILVMFMRGIF